MVLAKTGTRCFASSITPKSVVFPMHLEHPKHQEIQK